MSGVDHDPHPSGFRFDRQIAGNADAANLASTVIVLRSVRRALTRSGAHAAATHVQHAIDLIDPRVSQRLEIRLRNSATNFEAGTVVPASI